MVYKDNYDTYIKIKRPIIKSYDNKIFNDKNKYYTNRLTEREKEIVKSRFYHKKNPITVKEVLLTIIVFVLIFLLILINKNNYHID